MNELTLESQKIAFIGAGSMSEALLRGLVDANLVRSLSVVVLNRHNRERLDDLRKKYGIRVPQTNEPSERSALVREADIVVLAMKPKDVGAAVAEFRDHLRADQLIVSVVAGLSIETIERLLGRAQPIVRTMPNTSSSIGLGATGLACSPSVSEERKQLATQMFEAVGLVVPLEESMINLVTGLSGTGPAYVYYLMESMMAAGVEGGLSEEDARSLVVQTVLGAAHMVLSTDEDPAVLRAKVTSPNGTTHAAIGVLEQFEFRSGMMSAIARATERAQEMGDDIAASVLQSMTKSN
ncbi:pyrroline-5-carboxylate reductase [Paenibacillus alkalitolerans]|uniref:pyrroline-5-carboxylate reductase n=1 Tax=Paenibacillus alkalitolerans TaxID=2799335 RepID=UPI0018F2C93B|nr:pyrroline-5-carboxylate reductase [Paenibacillus alkalitolerans]